MRNNRGRSAKRNSLSEKGVTSTYNPGLTRLNFGKHKGAPLAQVPHDYLRWVLREVRLLPDTTRRDIEAVLATRGTPATPKPQNHTEPWDYEGPPGAIESRLDLAEIPY